MASEAGISKWYGNRVFTLATEANIEAMKKAAYVVEADVKKSFTKKGSGKESKRGRKVHRASIAGQPPAIDTGTLRASIMSSVTTMTGTDYLRDKKVIGSGGGKVGMNVVGKVGPDIEHIAAKSPVGTDVNYGMYLELGTRRMQPRPFLRPALMRTKRLITKIFRNANK